MLGTSRLTFQEKKTFQPSNGFVNITMRQQVSTRGISLCHSCPPERKIRETIFPFEDHCRTAGYCHIFAKLVQRRNIGKKNMGGVCIDRGTNVYLVDWVKCLACMVITKFWVLSKPAFS